MTGLLAVDFSNLLMRNASNPYNTDTDSEGHPMGGVTGAIKKIKKIIDDHSPDDLLIALDPDDGQSYRKKLSPLYKAHRKETDEDVKRQFAVGKEIVELLGWPSLAITEYEADDVIASAVTQYPGTSMVVSGDKDMLAIASEKVTIMYLRPGDYLLVTPKVCEEMMGVTPHRVRDLKASWATRLMEWLVLQASERRPPTSCLLSTRASAASIRRLMRQEHLRELLQQ